MSRLESTPGLGILRNALTVDVEDYFHVPALAGRFPRENWSSIPCRIERNVERILDLFARQGVVATFFVLGWIATRYPPLVRRIAESGHELASYGYSHERTGAMTPATFRTDIVRARALLEEISGQPVLGYRAPDFSIGADCPWAHDVIAEAGYRYSSSIYPLERGGTPGASRFPWRLPSGLAEIPVTAGGWGGRNWSGVGGGGFRLFPYALSHWRIARVNRRDARAAVFYFRPWAIDPDRPRVDGIPAKTRFCHYSNLSRTESRLLRLLADFRWGRMDDVFRDVL